MVKRLLHKLSGRKWKAAKKGTRWQDNPQFVAYFDQQISPGSASADPGTGRNSIHDALRKATQGQALNRAVSIGAGTGDNERALIKAGLVKHFDLFEVSADRVAQATERAATEGMQNQVTVHLADALERDVHEEYNFVYWDSALHHMFDVDRALRWSVRALKPGGVLLISEYIGPTRLQWTRAEVSAVRRFLAENRDVIGAEPMRVRPGSPFRRFKQFLRDPSEAPQSDRIVPLFKKHTGQELTILGGSAIHLAGGFLTGLEDRDPTLHDRLIALDRTQREKGHYHFGFGLWQKPA
ncbi:class I SAM-dependent methyltransferase [Roseovarius aestuariivivens]|uniref:class I SAM-dependent methyltransferase n=1 Tax=Roseovarius aestuariivivens TaxID=1888910 RepID=UPI001436A23B|nr:class I SAM-dependent methyltransferase [Roseovarius aestuariivivens]